VRPRVFGQVLILAAPVVGGFSSAAFLMFHAADFRFAALGGSGLHSAFLVWLVRDVVANYGIALPLLLFARYVGVRRLLVFALISVVAGSVVGYILANPAEYAWRPTDEDFAHGTYWGLFWSYTLTSGATGICFGIGTGLRFTSPTAESKPANA
jgi:hypothetical protein